jgi:hypothetical protein
VTVPIALLTAPGRVVAPPPLRYRTMADDIDVGNYPANPELVAGYVNGAWPTALGLPARFPGVPLVTIDVNGTRPDAMVLDMEWGDATPEMCPPWVAQHRVGDSGPVIYCSLSRVQEVLAAFVASGFRAPRGLWTAHYSGQPHLCTPAACGLPAAAADLVVATQYADPPLSGGPYDLSLCAPGWPA